MRLKDKVAVVTGSGSGLGKAMVQRFAQQGASLVVADINQAAVDATVSELTKAGNVAVGYRVDVSQRGQVRELMAQAVGKFGRIDILVNNAGVTRKRPFLTMNDEDWDFVLDVDLKGTFYCVQAVAEHMINRRYGKVLNISSAAGTGIGIHSDSNERLPQADNANYQAAKAAVIQLTKTFARELGSHGINVNCIAPGTLSAQMATTIRTPQEVEEHVRAKVKWAVLNRAGTPDDVANAALFLVSDESSFISGQLLCVDGGRTDRM